MKISEFESEARHRIYERLSDQVDHMIDQTNVMAEAARRFLFFVNAGSAVALIGFMGSSTEVRAMRGSWSALGCFCLGLIGLAAVLALNYHRSMRVAVRGRQAVDQFLSGQIDDGEFEKINAKLATPGIASSAATLFAYGSLLCWLAGLAIVWLRLIPAA